MTQILIIGAGPAGIRAAEILTQAGMHPVVIDEAAQAGGQIYRRPPAGFKRSGAALYGSEAHKAADLHRVFDDLVAAGKITHLPGRSVVGFSDNMAHVIGEAHQKIPYDRLILATGATDRLAPVPGWQSAGVYSLGAAQIALKSQGVTMGRNSVLAGSGPLLTLVAAQLIAAGAGLAAVLDTASLKTQVRGGLGMMANRPWVTLQGLRMRAGLGRRYHAGVTLEQIESDGEQLQKILWRDAGGRRHETACDMVAMGWHLRAETHLTDLAGAQFDWSGDFQQWLPRCDDLGRAGAALYVAGDGQRLLGADGAELAGRLAAIACLQDLGLAHPNPAPLLRKLRRMARFAISMAQAFPWPGQAIGRLPDSTVICRCEGVDAGTLRAWVPIATGEANRAKALSRVGMGRCQGRYCQLAGAEIVAACSDQSVAQVGRLRAQPPARPVPIATWLARQNDKAD